MSNRKSKLLTANFVVAFTFAFLLAIQLRFACAGSVAHAVTAYGNAQIDTAQSKFGGASGLFDGTGDYLSLASSADWDFGTGDWTIDFWMRRNGDQADYAGILGAALSTPAGYVIHFGNAATGTQNKIRLTSKASGAWNTELTTAAAIPDATWTHIAFVRNGNALTVYVDGVASASKDVTGYTYNSAASGLVIARLYSNTDGYYFKGWLDEFRISKGVARWTANFSPPSAAYTTDSPTVLLLHMDGTDGSTTFTDDSAVSGPDFSISPSPSSQSVGAGATASFTLNLAASGGFSGTVSLSVTSGAPPGVTCTITPNSISTFPSTATLSVPTLITTSGTYSIVVTGTCASPSITHTVTVTLTVSGPASYSFNVKASATQIVVTLTYSWTGSGAPPLGSITIAGPGGTPTLQESGAVVYDRILITATGGTNTYSIIHRATFTITAPGSAQIWTALISLSGVSNFSVAIEIS